MEKDVGVILAAAGKSSRFGESPVKKVFTLLAGRAVWLHSAEVLLEHPRVAQLLLVLDPGDREFFQEKFAAAAVMMGVEVAWGGAERWESVQNALTKIRPDLKWVAIHDAARPCLSTVWLDAVLEGAKTTGAAILATPIHGTVKRVDDRQRIETTVPRDRLWQAQTPQVFRYDVLTRAFASRGSLACTDESQLVESLGQAVQVVPGSLLNVKITNKEDLRFAEQALKSLPKKTGFTF